MFLATNEMVPFVRLVLAAAGIGLGAASGAVLNHVLDRNADAVMARTQARPLPTGAVGTLGALILALTLAILSMVLLVMWVNFLTAALTFASMIGYGVIYTVFLKYATPQNIVIGGAAGATPPVLGWVAVTGSVSADALLLFLIIFCWTPPHFWALALYRREEYASAGIPMLPVTHGMRYTRLQILLYTALLCAVTLLPFGTQMFGIVYLAGSVILNIGFIYYAVRLYKNYSDALARQTFSYSIQYLAMLFGLMLIDHHAPSLVALITH
jgi:protoheme IX farnesyltransferase